MAKNDLQGALDLLILKSLSHLGSMHGFGIILHIERVSDELLNVEEGSLYPALHRMEQSGWVRSEWAVTESSRRARFYSLTAAGRKQLAAREKTGSRLPRVFRQYSVTREVNHEHLPSHMGSRQTLEARP